MTGAPSRARAEVIGEDGDVLVRHTHDVDEAWRLAVIEFDRAHGRELRREDYAARVEYARVSPVLPHQTWVDFSYWVHPTDKPGPGAFPCVHFMRR